MTPRPVGALLIATLLAPTLAPAADVEAGRGKAAACVACHGPDGNSSNPAVPSIAGQVAIYLHWQLLLYRDKRRVDPQMAPIATALSESDMADLAAFFAAQRPAPPPSAPPASARSDAGRRLAEAYHCNDCHGRDLPAASTRHGCAACRATTLSRRCAGSRRGRVAISMAR